VSEAPASFTIIALLRLVRSCKGGAEIWRGGEIRERRFARYFYSEMRGIYAPSDLSNGLNDLREDAGGKRRMVLNIARSTNRVFMNSEDEAALLHRSRNGDQNAFNELVKLHYEAIARLAFRILRNREAAEDATQIVFFRAWKNLNRFRGDSGFSTWLHAIAVNHCLNEAKRRKSESLRVEAMDDETWMRKIGGIAAPAVHWDRRLALREALERMPEKLRAVVMLYFLSELTIQEIASGLNVPPSTVHRRLRDGVKRLEVALKDAEDRR
jgi:RNA polymerase sigma-70 factor (ECF subfamily)